MVIVFRVDANEILGTGHLMRCLTLAKALKNHCREIHFICKSSKVNIFNLVKDLGFILHFINENLMSQLQDVQQTSDIISLLPKVPDCLVIDHYGLNYVFESKIRPYVHKVFVVDDFANTKHDCDYLLDQNIFPVDRYKKLVPENCIQLIGTKYALLRNEFPINRAQVNRKSCHVNHVLINFGGGDDRGLIEKSVLAILALELTDIYCNVILGQANPNKKYLLELLAPYEKITIYEHVNNIAELMVKADLAIGSGGSSVWERCCLGLPSVVIAVSDIEDQLATVCVQQNLIRYLGRYEHVSITDINQELRYLLKNRSVLQQMSINGMNVVDGLGAEAVMKNILAITHE